MAGENDSRPILMGGEKLREDLDRSGGGGEKYHPFSFKEAVEVLSPQVAALQEEAVALPRRLRAERVIFEATLLPNYLAPSYFPTPLLEAAGLHSVGSRHSTGTYRTPTRTEEARSTKSILLAGSEEEISNLRAILETPEYVLSRSIREAVVEFSDITMPRGERVIRRRETPDSDATEAQTWEAVLHRLWASSARKLKEEVDEVYRKWVAYINSLGGEVVDRYRRTVSGLTFVPIRLASERMNEAVLFNPLRAIRPMPHLRPLVPVPFRVATGAAPAPLEQGTTARSSVRIAVFDGGLDPTCPFVSPFVKYSELTDAPPEEVGIDHGSTVTNSILYRYRRDHLQLKRPNVLVDHYRVWPVPSSEAADFELNWILDRILEVVRGGRYGLVNLSLGPEECVEDDCEPTRWTAELDALAEQAGVLFVTAAGNNGECIPGFDRVQVPGDMANGLAVGAAVQISSASFERASYSAKGPGRWGGRVQPVGLCFGGDLATTPFIGLGTRGKLLETQGTSFAAPLALGGMTDLIVGLPGSPVIHHLLKAFAVHFAQRRRRGHEIVQHGFGLLSEEYGPALGCSHDEVTVIYQTELARDKVSGFTLPLPENIDESDIIDIRWTLCYASPVDSAEALDYTRAGVTAVFRPHTNRYAVNDARGRRVGVFDIANELDKLLAALDSGGVLSDEPVSDSGREIRLNEQRLRDAGKWETVLQHRFGRKARSLYRPRLDLSYYVREGGVLVEPQRADDLSLSLLVSLKSRSGQQFYDLVRQQFDVLVPIVVEIEV